MQASLDYKQRLRQQRRLTLGDAAVVPLGGEGGARDLARQALRQVANGQDPAEQKKERREAATVGEGPRGAACDSLKFAGEKRRHQAARRPPGRPRG